MKSFLMTAMLCVGSAVLIQCPPDTNVPHDLSLGHACGGVCNAKGSCAAGFFCQKPCEADKYPSASFVVTEMGSPEPEGVCVVAVDAFQKAIPGGAIQKDVCDDEVQKAAAAAVAQIDTQSNSMNSIQLVQVVEASSQVVNGVKWTLTLAAGVSECSKSTSYSLCDTPIKDENKDLYHVTLFDSAWQTPRYTLGEWKILPRVQINSAARTGSSKTQQENKETNVNGEEPVKMAKPCLGCPKSVDSLNSDVIDVAKKGLPIVLDAAASKLGCASDSAGLQFHSVINATEQMVAGKKYNIYVSMHTPTLFGVEGSVPQSLPECHMVLWVRSWMEGNDGFQLMDWSCDESATTMLQTGCKAAPHNMELSKDFDKTETKPLMGGSGGIGPAWTYDKSVERPAGEKNMGTWTKAVYTAEQQQRLGVDEEGNKATEPNEEEKPVVGGSGGIGPAWTYDKSVERPAGEKNMGTWTKAVYTAEQEGSKTDAVATSTTASVNLETDTKTNLRSGGLSGGGVAGIAMGAAFVVGALGLALVVASRRGRQAQNMQSRTRGGEMFQTASTDSSPTYAQMEL